MHQVIFWISLVNVLFFFLHEFDAFKRGEWKMMAFLRKLKDEQQYLVFLYAHVPLTIFMFYYVWTVFASSNFVLWLVVNILWVLHLLLHLVATKWKSNVFTSRHSFMFIAGAAITGVANLCLAGYY